MTISRLNTQREKKGKRGEAAPPLSIFLALRAPSDYREEKKKGRGKDILPFKSIEKKGGGGKGDLF